MASQRNSGGGADIERFSHVSMIPNDCAATLTCCCPKASCVEKSQAGGTQQVSQFRCTIVKSTYQIVATETRIDRYSFNRSDKGMLANDYSAGEGPGIYSNPARHSVCVNEIMIVNCEGSNTKFSSIMTGSTFHH
jgi:hypothetical protein